MGNYLGVDFEFEGAGLAAKVLEPLFYSSFFTPVGLCSGIRKPKGEHWFLAGYALEFLLKNSVSKRPKKTQITIAAQREDEEYQYLESLSKWIRTGKSPGWEYSPFEIIDSATEMTFLEESVKLNTNTLSYANEWMQDFEFGIFYLFGSVKLAFQRADDSPWTKAFRFLALEEFEGTMGDYGSLFMIITAATMPYLPKITSVSISGRSKIWLRAANFDGHVTEEDADQNLANLAALVKSVEANSVTRLLSKEVFFDQTKDFLNESERIKLAFTEGSLGM